MPLTDKQRQWRNAWDSKNRCNLACRVYKDYAAHVKRVAAENGTTVNAILIEALDAYLAEHNQPYQKMEK